MKQKPKQRRRKHTQPTQKRRSVKGPHKQTKGKRALDRMGTTGLLTTQTSTPHRVQEADK
jgi:hypothetical protein